MSQPFSAEDLYDMKPLRRELYLRVWDDQYPVHPIINRLKFLEDHMPQEKIDPALKWLITHRLIGKAFIAWFRGPCQNSDLEMLRLLTRIVDNAKLAPLIAGKNFKV
jgi:hypothetical protein